MDFTRADLTFAVDPAGKSIGGRSLLTFAVQKPIERIHFDLAVDRFRDWEAAEKAKAAKKES